MIESWEIAGGLLEYIDDTHTYLYDGVILPSITQILKITISSLKLQAMIHGMLPHKANMLLIQCNT